MFDASPRRRRAFLVAPLLGAAFSIAITTRLAAQAADSADWGSYGRDPGGARRSPLAMSVRPLSATAEPTTSTSPATAGGEVSS